MSEFNFLLPDNMKKLGFDDISDPIDKQKGYYKYQNDGTKHYNTDYNRNYPEPKGKVIVYVNFGYGIFPFIGIKQDADSRTSYNGICPDEDFLEKLLKNIR